MQRDSEMEEGNDGSMDRQINTGKLVFRKTGFLCWQVSQMCVCSTRLDL